MKSLKEIQKIKDELLESTSQTTVDEILCMECGAVFEDCDSECPNQIELMKNVEECEKNGHIFESSADVENGTEDLSCTKCGYELTINW